MLKSYFVVLLVQFLHTWRDDGLSRLKDCGIFIDYLWL